MVVFEPISVELPMRPQSDGMALQLQNKDDTAQQTVFRGFASDNVRVYHARRPHKKSRKGCLTCKRRRVKCDEGKPCCERCQRHGAICQYPSSLEPLGKGKSIQRKGTSGEPSKTAFSLSLMDLESKIHEILGTHGGVYPFTLKEQGASHPLTTVALQHFVFHSTGTTSPLIQTVMRSDMIQVAFTSPYLMYTLLGVGMLHLNRMRPGYKLRQLAEAHFWHQATVLYQKSLNARVSQKNVDALLSTCMFMGLTSICPEGFIPTDSWVLSNKPSAMNWLCLQNGLRCIIELSQPYLPGSIWGRAFAHLSQEERVIFDCSGKIGREGLDPDLADLCGVDEHTTEATNLYYSPLQYLTELLQLEKNPSNAAQCTTFMGRLEHGFLALLRARDPPALLILAQWMGLMCSMSQWQPWVEGRIRGECIAICMYLEPSTDGRIRRLLALPAEGCGYTLQPMVVVQPATL